MILKRFEINVYDCGSIWEEEINKKLRRAISAHILNAPYNSGTTMLVYAVYPEEQKELPSDL